MSSFLLTKSFNNALVLVNLPYPEKYIKLKYLWLHSSCHTEMLAFSAF